MFIPRPQDTIHKAQLYRLLVAIADDIGLIKFLRFKGGTCAAMQGYLDRFSVDLDFDFLGEKKDLLSVHKNLKIIFKQLDLIIADYSKNGLQYFLKYQAPKNTRHTIKIEAQFPPPKNNEYQAAYLPDINRTMICQTIETMFANKLVAILDRYKKSGSIAGRDIFDVYHFFSQQLPYKKEIIEERRNTKLLNFFQELYQFIEKNITQTIINEDLNSLLPATEFQKIRKTLKDEVLLFLKDEISRLQN
ncbi:MAG: hypothetical protein A2233_02810 [Candidatus Kerfeldbacteria bacterium RIFOXYA2_FULL_38_24]|uniref:Nucleotidyl transferase AbiEii/AbiGii toxin family protein n=1 Tax=Candidatus Kerfeldbacteria bacterium RIFOXYB2_FULL_38_14 TaxID=1798547 RepID=A0A1G2BEW8_9BACT|nr:MAG: hypothetical protein A2233_02810 [Candidatus Kerfeldbacteria bacterium RIFOXYA2_FULL_38_24]OGY87585.1 MAG: hypothetical protein A2319_03205 [Candidatus Kerfeldbacteria bacterium RIFOXYB2_FULL_38_14]OGY90045.1 MAG: hypothetical protein A2458_00105 [Candidatus Kerfeldbacteria bacterium RIFOXYC2_FULL_38_9]